MKKSKFGVLSMVGPLSLGLTISLVACGGSDSDGGGTATGGSKTSTGGTSSSSGGTSSSSAGSTSKAGSTGTGTGNTGNTGSGAGVPGDTPLNELTDDQAQALCEAFGKRFDNAQFEDIACKLESVFSAILAQTDAEAQMMCKTAYDQCKSMPPDTTQNCEKPSSDCTATVDELNACLDAYNESLGDVGASLPSCDTLKAGDLTALFSGLGSMMQPAACTAYQAKCPDGPAPPSPDMGAP